MNVQLTICQACGRPVHAAPGICVLCGAELGPVFICAPKKGPGTKLSARLSVMARWMKHQPFEYDPSESPERPQRETAVAVSSEGREGVGSRKPSSLPIALSDFRWLSQAV